MSNPTNPNRQTALITGASGGLGLELAELLAKAGHDLVLVARSAAKLEGVARDLSKKYGVQTLALSSDLSAIGAGKALLEELRSRELDIDILVNNAGFASYGKFHENDLDAEINMVDLNIRTLTELTGLLLPSMVKRGRGRVLNIASTAAFQSGPLMAVYYASKAYVLFFSEAIANELEGTGVTVTAFCPGAFSSGFQDRADMQDSKLIKGRKLPTALEVARIGFAGMMKGQVVVLDSMFNYVQAQSARFLPRKVVTKIVRGVQERSH
jgi:uncharacterized protein